MSDFKSTYASNIRLHRCRLCISQQAGRSHARCGCKELPSKTSRASHCLNWLIHLQCYGQAHIDAPTTPLPSPKVSH